jgi:excisionase family DNA binding protein
MSCRRAAQLRGSTYVGVTNRRERVKPIQRVAVSPAEAALMLGLSRSRTYQLLADGTLRSVKIGGRRLVPIAAIEALVSEAA